FFAESLRLAAPLLRHCGRRTIHPLDEEPPAPGLPPVFTPHRRPKGGPMKAQNRPRPQLEALEDRYAPSNLSLTGAQHDNWHTNTLTGLFSPGPSLGPTDNGFDHGHHGHQYLSISW